MLYYLIFSIINCVEKILQLLKNEISKVYFCHSWLAQESINSLEDIKIPFESLVIIISSFLLEIPAFAGMTVF